MTQWQQPPQYGQQWPAQMQPQGPLKHSGLGIASFIMSIASAVFSFVLIVVAGIMETNTPGGIDEESPEAVMVGLGIIASLLLAVGGVVIGIIGCVLPNRNKIFAVLGTVFNGLVLLGVLGLMILGLAAG